MKSLETDEMIAKQTRQPEKCDLKARVKKLRAEGRTYREIAKQERISIAQISRILNEPIEGEAGPKPQTSSVNLDGEEASRVFQMIERGTPLTKIVIETKMHPDKVKQLFQKSVELKLEQLKPLGYLMLTKEEMKEIMHIANNLSTTGILFVLEENIFEDPKSLLRKYDNPNDYSDIAHLFSITERIIRRASIQ